MIKILKYIGLISFFIVATVWWFIFFILMSLICVCARILGKDTLCIERILFDKAVFPHHTMLANKISKTKK